MDKFILKSRAFISLLEAGASVNDLEAKLAEATSAFGDIPEPPAALAKAKEPVTTIWQAEKLLSQQIRHWIILEVTTDRYESAMTAKQKAQREAMRRERRDYWLKLSATLKSALATIEKAVAAGKWPDDARIPPIPEPPREKDEQDDVAEPLPLPEFPPSEFELLPPPAVETPPEKTRVQTKDSLLIVGQVTAVNAAGEISYRCADGATGKVPNVLVSDRAGRNIEAARLEKGQWIRIYHVAEKNPPRWVARSVQITGEPVEAKQARERAAKAKPAADPEKVAANKLELAKQLLKEGKQRAARIRLEQLISNYPKTKAAAEAKKLLKETPE